ncbi:MerR family transcriptional regulator [Silanimonas sp.]|uniref:MerR family transcriptional regulator n=1 Tax=Silanimonas sp. TaxID=1929290 RepID=UPI001BB83A0E|nr:MerR family transcriptional regulator [Silanimonas sp.]MBS3897026.1 MerR family transcriptional regulator [Silanimonas sp.]
MLDPGSNRELPPIPAKRYFTIGEVAELCDVKPHVLRYWETEFPTLKPVKRRGNRRYYQRQDVLVIRQIRGLLYEEGYTIGGARLRIETEKQASAALARSGPTASAADAPADAQLLASIREELEALLELLRR